MGDEQVGREVLAGRVERLLILRLQFFDALDLAVEGVVGQERASGDLDDVVDVGAVVLPSDRQHREARAVLGDAERFGGGHLHRLLFEHDLRLEVTADDHGHAGDHRHPQREPGDGPPELLASSSSWSAVAPT